MVNITARAPQQVEKAMRTAIPSKAAVMAKIHFRQNFRCDLLKTRAFAVLQTIIDLDARLKKLNASKLAKHISWRKADFMEGPMKECYVVSMKRE